MPDSIYAFKFEHMLVIGANNANGLGAVHGATAAHSDNGVASGLPVELCTGHDFAVTRVGCDSCVRYGLDTFLSKAVDDLSQRSDFLKDRTGNDQRLFDGKICSTHHWPCTARGQQKMDWI